MITLFIVISIVVVVCVFAAMRIKQEALRYGLIFAVVFSGIYGTYLVTRHVSHLMFYSGYIRQNERYSDYLYRKLNAGDFETVSNAVVFFNANLEVDAESFTNMIQTVNSILEEDLTNSAPKSEYEK